MMSSYYGMMGYGAGIGTITLLLFWTVMVLGIAALWKYITRNKK